MDNSIKVAVEKEISLRTAGYIIALNKLDDYHTEASIIWIKNNKIYFHLFYFIIIIVINLLKYIINKSSLIFIFINIFLK